MPAFDLVEASGKSYSLVYKESAYLYRLAAAPIIIKLLCYLVLSGLGWEDSFIRQALVMLPSSFADGWMAAHLVRLILLDQKWPFRPTGNPEEDVHLLHDRAQGIMGGMILYALLEFLTTGLMQFFYAGGQEVWDTPVDQATPYFIIMFTGLIVLVWAFRLLWLYIPAAVGYPLRRFMSQIRGFMTSFYLIGVWLVCFMPVFFFFRFFLSLLIAPYGETISALPFLVEFLVRFIVVVMDTIITLLVTAGVTFGVQEMIAKRTGADTNR